MEMIIDLKFGLDVCTGSMFRPYQRYYRLVIYRWSISYDLSIGESIVILKVFVRGFIEKIYSLSFRGYETSDIPTQCKVYTSGFSTDVHRVFSLLFSG